jgi:hypothetical protein
MKTPGEPFDIGWVGLIDTGVSEWRTLLNIMFDGRTIADAPDFGNLSYFDSPRYTGYSNRRRGCRSGLHVMKAGIDLMRMRYEGDSESRPVLIRPADGTIARQVTFDGPVAQQVKGTDIALFAQDRWQPIDRLAQCIGDQRRAHGRTGTRVTRPGLAPAA